MTGPAFDNSSEGAAVSASTSDWVVASVVFAASLALLLATMGIGIPRDESFYFHAADVYIGWFEELWRNVRAGRLAESFTKASVDEHLSYNREHPALMKVAFALSERLWHDALGWLDRVTALRLPGAAAGAATVALTFVFARQLFGTVAGLAAAGALLFQPRFFFHAHLACFDVPITGAWLGTVYAYWRSHDSRGWAAATGALFGLGLCTKLNALFLP
ncbi:MAG: glycosyltransferase family 39 protein, partial [Bradymonadaceae bacterium]